MLVGCNSESVETTEAHNSGNTSYHETESEPNSHLSNWIKKWRELPAGEVNGSTQDQATIAFLREAEASLTARDFAYILEKISDDSEDSGLAELHTWLARYAIKQAKTKLPKWYHRIEAPELKEGIAYAVGVELAKNNPQKKEAVLSWLEVKKEKIRFMLGFGIQSITSDPNKSFNDYLAWGSKNGALESFPELIDKLPNNTDFKACDDKIPHSGAHIAVACRKAIYQRWAAVNAVQLIDHLVARQRYGSDLYIALLEWGKQNPEGLENWLGQVEASGKQNPAWDTTRRIRVEAIMATEPEKAWRMTRDIRREATREVLLRKVHAIWIKTDYKAADEARKKHIRLTPRKNRDGKPNTTA